MQNPIIVGCLHKLMQGDLGAALVLADYLEEAGHPLAGGVRSACDIWRSACLGDIKDQRPDNEVLRFCMAINHRILRGRVCSLLQGSCAVLTGWRYYVPEIVAKNAALVEELFGAHAICR